MNPINKILLQLKIKHNVGTEYLTIYIPVALALLFLITSVIYVEFMPNGTTDNSAGDKNNLSEIIGSGGEGELSEAELIKLKEAAKTKRENALKTQTAPEKDKHLDDIIIFSVLIAIIPYSIYTFMHEKKIRRYEEEYGDFLFEISELMRGGIDPIKAVIELSDSDLGTITKHVKTTAARMSFGKSFEYSMKKMAETLESNLIKKYTELVIHAARAGGNVSDLILTSSEDMKRFINLDREKEASLSTYLVILYMAQGILFVLAAVFILYTLPFIQNMDPGTTASFGLSMGGGSKLSDEAIITYMFHVVMINALFVGLIIGKLTGGSMKHGLKHAVILIVLSYVIFVFFLMPQPKEVEQFIITPVSYPAEGFIQTKLSDQVVFKVTDLNENPRENVTVVFSIKGPGESKGSLKPVSGTTNAKGLISTEVTMGTEVGMYVIEVSAGKNKNTVEIKAVFGGG